MKTTDENKSLHEWQIAGIEAALDMYKFILEPLGIFAELLRGYNNDDDLTIQDVSTVLRLLVLGAMADPKVICSYGGTFDQVRPLQMLKHFDADWLELLEKYRER